MGKRFRFSKKKWLILGLLCALFPLFQNMSSLDDFQDIRKIAPRKPAGDWDSPIATYFPKDFSGGNLGDVQRSFLSHNFDPMLKDLEVSYLHGDKRRFEFGEAQGAQSAEQDVSGARWKIGLVNPTKLRLSYENDLAGQNFQLVCEAQSGQEGMSLKMTRPFSPQFNVGFVHETGRRESQVQLDYHW